MHVSVRSYFSLVFYIYIYNRYREVSVSDLSVGFRDLASLGSQPRIVWESTSSWASGGAYGKLGGWRGVQQVGRLEERAASRSVLQAGRLEGYAAPTACCKARCKQ